MHRARLLHGSEWVEVIEIDHKAEKASILQHGFRRTVPLTELVFDEETASSPSGHSLPSQRPIAGFGLEAILRPGSPEVVLLLQSDPHGPTYIGLYLRAEAQPLWQSLLQEVLEAHTQRHFTISKDLYPPPWVLRLHAVSLLEGPAMGPPEVRLYESSLKPLFFTKSGQHRIELSRLHPPSIRERPSPAPSVSSKEKSQSPSEPPLIQPEIDLHIDRLAPEMIGAPPELIFAYQKEALEQYLDRAYRAGLPSVCVIHGIGRKRLFEFLLQVCKDRGWMADPLLLPPYEGGATQVSFRR